MIWAQVSALQAIPVTVNLFQNSVCFFSQQPFPSFTIALYCHCWKKKYRAVRNFLQMIIKRNTLIGLKRLEYGITKILYAIYYIMWMYSDTLCFNFFPFPHLNTNQCLKPPSQPHESKTYSLKNIFNLLKTGYNFLSSKFLRFWKLGGRF